MKFINKVIDNGFYGISAVEKYDNFIRFVIDKDTISDKFMRELSRAMAAEDYEANEEIFVSVIVPYKDILDFNDAILHISEISHTLRPEYIRELTNAIQNKEQISKEFGLKIEFETVELINLLSAVR
jgi:hypothetical protein